MRRGHRYAGATFGYDGRRHFGSPSIPKAPPQPTPVEAAPTKSDLEIQEEARQARLAAQRRRGRRATVLTTGQEAPGPVASGSLTPPGGSTKLGAA